MAFCQDGGWRISGLFDLMEPYFGDGEADLSRSVAVYVEVGLDEPTDLSRISLPPYSGVILGDQDAFIKLGEQTMLQDHQDAFGHAMYDHFTGQGGFEIIERDDGLISQSPGPRHYFLEHADWPVCEQQAMEYVRGRVLDVGCGAGRHALYLQAQGFEVLGVDVSPLAVQVSQARGLREARVLSITQLSRRLGRFDTLLLLGNNFALVGTPKRARWLLRRFYHMTPPDGRIIAGTRDPYQTDLPEHLDYHQRNRERGQMSGAARLRVRYKRFVTPWIDFLMLSQEELQTLLGGTGWHASEFLDGPQGIYVAILEKG